MTQSPSPPGPAPSPDLASLLETVAEQGRQESHGLVAQARAHTEERVREAERTGRELEERAAAAGAADGEREARRRVARAQIEASQAMLRVREAHVERVLERARERLAAWLATAEGAQWLGGAVRAAARALGEERVRVRVRADARETLAGALGDAGPAADWEATEDGPPGVVVLSADGRRSVDLTVPGLAQRRAEQARHAAARVLFGGEERP